MTSVTNSGRQEQCSASAARGRPTPASAIKDSYAELLEDTYYIDADSIEEHNLQPFGLDLEEVWERFNSEVEIDLIQNEDEEREKYILSRLGANEPSETDEWGYHMTEADFEECMNEPVSFPFISTTNNGRSRDPKSGKAANNQVQGTVPLEEDGSFAKKMKVFTTTIEEIPNETLEKNSNDVYSFVIENSTGAANLIRHDRSENIELPEGFNLGSLSQLEDTLQNRPSVLRQSLPADFQFIPQASKPQTPTTSRSRKPPRPKSASTGKLNSLNDLMQSEKKKKLMKSRVQYQQRRSDPNKVMSILSQASKSGDSRSQNIQIVDLDMEPVYEARAVPSSSSSSLPKASIPPMPRLTPSIPKPSTSKSMEATMQASQQNPSPFPLVLECNICGMMFPRNNDQKFRYHMIVVHDIECGDELIEKCKSSATDVKRCKHCRKVIVNGFVEHWMKCSPSSPLEDAFIEFEGSTKTNAKHKCGICNELFEMRCELKHHVRRTHESISSKMILDPDFRCAQCLRKMDNSEDLCKHCVTCSDQKPCEETILELSHRLLFCDFCGTEHETLLETSKCYFKRNVFRCLLCVSILKDKTRILEHMREYHTSSVDSFSKTQNPQFRCSICHFGPDVYTKIFPHISIEHYQPALINAIVPKLSPSKQTCAVVKLPAKSNPAEKVIPPPVPVPAATNSKSATDEAGKVTRMVTDEGGKVTSEPTLGTFIEESREVVPPTVNPVVRKSLPSLQPLSGLMRPPPGIVINTNRLVPTSTTVAQPRTSFVTSTNSFVTTSPSRPNPGMSMFRSPSYVRMHQKKQPQIIQHISQLLSSSSSSTPPTTVRLQGHSMLPAPTSATPVQIHVKTPSSSATITASPLPRPPMLMPATSISKGAGALHISLVKSSAAKPTALNITSTTPQLTISQVTPSTTTAVNNTNSPQIVKLQTTTSSSTNLNNVVSTEVVRPQSNATSSKNLNNTNSSQSTKPRVNTSATVVAKNSSSPQLTVYPTLANTPTALNITSSPQIVRLKTNTTCSTNLNTNSPQLTKSQPQVNTSTHLVSISPQTTRSQLTTPNTVVLNDAISSQAARTEVVTSTATSLNYSSSSVVTLPQINVSTAPVINNVISPQTTKSSNTTLATRPQLSMSTVPIVNDANSPQMIKTQVWRPSAPASSSQTIRTQVITVTPSTSISTNAGGVSTTTTPIAIDIRPTESPARIVRTISVDGSRLIQLSPPNNTNNSASEPSCQTVAISKPTASAPSVVQKPSKVTELPTPSTSTVVVRNPEPFSSCLTVIKHTTSYNNYGIPSLQSGACQAVNKILSSKAAKPTASNTNTNTSSTGEQSKK